jgi:hypothetical protein
MSLHLRLRFSVVSFCCCVVTFSDFMIPLQCFRNFNGVQYLLSIAASSPNESTISLFASLRPGMVLHLSEFCSLVFLKVPWLTSFVGLSRDLEGRANNFVKHLHANDSTCSRSLLVLTLSLSLFIIDNLLLHLLHRRLREIFLWNRQ